LTEFIDIVHTEDFQNELTEFIDDKELLSSSALKYFSRETLNRLLSIAANTTWR
jgi:hypothetical protein